MPLASKACVTCSSYLAWGQLAAAGAIFLCLPYDEDRCSSFFPLALPLHRIVMVLLDSSKLVVHGSLCEWPSVVLHLCCCPCQADAERKAVAKQKAIAQDAEAARKRLEANR